MLPSPEPACLVIADISGRRKIWAHADDIS
jgi:hypothetical protein